MTTEAFNSAENMEERISELTRIFDEKRRERGFTVARYKITTDFIAELVKKYGQDEIEKYRLYHVVAGSTPDLTIATEFDLPEGEIEHFMREGLK